MGVILVQQDNSDPVVFSGDFVRSDLGAAIGCKAVYGRGAGLRSDMRNLQLQIIGQRGAGDHHEAYSQKQCDQFLHENSSSFCMAFRPCFRFP